MKRPAALAIAVLAVAAVLNAQDIVRSARYEVSSESGSEDAEALAQEMEKRFDVYESLFRFDPGTLGGKLRVRAFSDKAAFDAYLSAALGSAREGACYLHYPAPERRELVVLRGAGLDGRAFSHQAFVQFLRAFVPNAPAWMREGFAVVFETLQYDAEKNSFGFEENLGWLDTIKGWKTDVPELGGVLAESDEEAAKDDKFIPASWAIASFLLNARDESYRRFLYESIMLMDAASTAEENNGRILHRGAVWISPARASEDIAEYITARKTFAELIEDGRGKYAAKDPAAAQEAFMEAAELKPSHYAPYYYLGLLAYERKDYAAAETAYRNALKYGADEALVSFALGVNAAADGRQADARSFLDKAKMISPGRYAVRVDELLARLK